ncbi:FAD-dependent monooxygenase [Amycolatopsis pithecellobii]|uniref:FAD-binding protein n=1 Tax=Amycolatopsis pithecellobii TaxID=664692 RepID=A0A6N7Z3G4_9PSEU|nr:FAD-dependent monooxygenase [Amycolatopsis pithecellobii]MTD54584.1 FAD-binding protein [Amycolatopsis pithecellobii]
MVAGGWHAVSAGPDVLVVGAGPTGLTTALQAHENGATVRIVERRPVAFRPSRAMIMHSRALESLRPLGVTAGLLDRGDRAPRAELHLGPRRVSARLADVGLRDTAFPHLTLLRQMDVEEVLTDALKARGVEVERGVEFVDLSQDAAAAHVVLRHGGQSEQTTCRFVAACDGAGSTGRRIAGIGWQGAPYREQVILADAELDGELTPGVMHVVAARQGLVFVFALGEGATWRILATRPRQHDVPSGQPGEEVPAADVQRILDDAQLPVLVRHLRWSSQVRLQHRLAQSFRDGRLFLAGDAAHTHSPAAAQGMNTGILDAVNLGWKLAFANDDGQHTALLDSYQAERRPVARQVLALTHLVFFAEASTHPLPALVRGTLVPLLAPALPPLLNEPHLMAQVVRFLSQSWVRYRHSTLSTAGRPGGPGPRPGDRLPDAEVECDGRTARLHDLTARPGVQLLLERGSLVLDDAPLGRHVTVHRVSSWTGHGLVAVRPDGYVGFRCGASDIRRLTSWLDVIAAR